jgi:hypothetical protein
MQKCITFDLTKHNNNLSWHKKYQITLGIFGAKPIHPICFFFLFNLADCCDILGNSEEKCVLLQMIFDFAIILH